jgi:hypothetical protein
MAELIDSKIRIIQRTLQSQPLVQAAYIYGSYLHSSTPGDLDMYIVLNEAENILEMCDVINLSLRFHLPKVRLDINTCIDPANELTVDRRELLPYHIYVARTGVLAYGNDILNPFCAVHLPIEVVCTRVASMANRIRHIYFNSLDDRHNKWHKWLIYGMADAELAHTGTIDVDLRVTAKRFYSRYPEQLTFLAPVFTDQILPLDWYVSAFHTSYDHLKMLDNEQSDYMVLSKHEGI